MIQFASPNALKSSSMLIASMKKSYQRNPTHELGLTLQGRSDAAGKNHLQKSDERIMASTTRDIVAAEAHYHRCYIQQSKGNLSNLHVVFILGEGEPAEI